MKTRPLFVTTCLLLSLLWTGCTTTSEPAPDPQATTPDDSQQFASLVEQITPDKITVAKKTLTDSNHAEMHGVEYNLFLTLPKQAPHEELHKLAFQLQFSGKTFEILGIDGSAVDNTFGYLESEGEQRTFHVSFTHVGDTMTPAEQEEVIRSASQDVTVALYERKGETLNLIKTLPLP